MSILRSSGYRISIAAGLFILICSLCFAAERPAGLQRQFYRGNDAYEKGNFLQAIIEYEKIISAGYDSAPLYYNLGNAYFKSGELGKAILNYERARRLDPGDADLKANLRFAEARIKGRPATGKGPWSWKPMRLYAENAGINALLLIASGVYVTLILVAAFCVYRPDLIKRLLLPALALFVFGVFNGVVAWHEIDGIGKEAVVITPEAESRYGPVDSATPFFKLYEGMKVRALNKKGDWYKIKRPDNKVGWVKEGEIAII